MTRRSRRPGLTWQEMAPGGELAATSELRWELAGASDLVGCYDPLDGTVLVAGERAVVCLACGTGYHQTSWDFLAMHNAGACCNCRRTSRFSVLALASVSTSATRADPHATVIRLEALPDHLGQAIVFEGWVLHHQISTATGTHFVKFHNDRNPFKGFKLVIFASELYKWEQRGIDPVSYEHHLIQVRGLLLEHPQYGLEILPKTPVQIRIIT
ncbi:MAG: hypothetical protein HY692_07690 [Cyanobacteria bacterium NC_groundwater_1444_Ag_S-0.65um_54_12]|nr:hypothetical protein [Cyanobacteria bacterium NC_groundwater_1444_Ag_S-0.65um_54_12]